MEDARRRNAGLLNHSLALFAEVLRYLKARAQLAGEEAKAAGRQYGVAGAMAVGALLVAVLGYVFLVITIVFALGLAFHSERAWLAVLGGVALLHLVGAVALIFLAKNSVADAPFPETLAEIEKDRLWLRQLTAKE